MTAAGAAFTGFRQLARLTPCQIMQRRERAAPEREREPLLREREPLLRSLARPTHTAKSGGETVWGRGRAASTWPTRAAPCRTPPHHCPTNTRPSLPHMPPVNPTHNPPPPPPAAGHSLSPSPAPSLSLSVSPTVPFLSRRPFARPLSDPRPRPSRISEEARPSTSTSTRRAPSPLSLLPPVAPPAQQCGPASESSPAAGAAPAPRSHSRAQA